SSTLLKNGNAAENISTRKAATKLSSRIRMRSFLFLSVFDSLDSIEIAYQTHMESKSSGEKASAEILRKIAILVAISKTRSATEPSIHTRRQHEVSGNLCLLCADHVDIRPNDLWYSLGFAAG